MLWAHYPGRRVQAAAAACILLTAAAMLHVAVGIQGMRAKTNVRQPTARAHARLQQWRMDRLDCTVSSVTTCAQDHKRTIMRLRLSASFQLQGRYSQKRDTTKKRADALPPLSHRCHVTVHAHGRICWTWALLPARRTTAGLC